MKKVFSKAISVILTLALILCPFTLSTMAETTDVVPPLPKHLDYLQSRAVTPIPYSVQSFYVSTVTPFALNAYTGNRLTCSVNVGESSEVNFVDIYFYEEYSNSPTGRVLVEYERFPTNSGTVTFFQSIPITAQTVAYRFIVVPLTFAFYYPPEVTIAAVSYTA